MLSKLGASVDTVDDGLQAANAVATATALYGQESSNVDWTGNEKPYDVVLMDCQVWKRLSVFAYSVCYCV